MSALGGLLSDDDVLRRVEPLIRRLGNGLSEYCPANLHLFSTVHGYRFHAGALPYVEGVTYDGVRHRMPLFPLDAASDAALEELAGPCCLYPVAEADLGRFDRTRFAWHHNPDDSDYLFDAQALSSMRGAALKAKRSQARAFAREEAPLAVPLDGGNRAEARAVLDGWIADVDKPWAETDYAACRLALDRFEALGLGGVLVRTGEGVPVAFGVAGPLPDGSAAVHFAKARRSRPGAFPYMIQALALSLAERHRRLNFEQDLGSPGLRQAKRAFGPIGQLHKYRVSLRRK